MSVVSVADKITMSRIMNPVKETNPPSAVLKRLFVESADNVLFYRNTLGSWN